MGTKKIYGSVRFIVNYQFLSSRSDSVVETLVEKKQTVVNFEK